MNSNGAIAGMVAGSIHKKQGYRFIGIERRHYKAARLAWLWMTGEWPSHDVDHRNRDRADDRWENLRHATRSQNGCNRGLSRNTSGFKGVSWDKSRGRWFVSICVGGKQKNLGRFDCVEDAIAARNAAAERLHGEFSCDGHPSSRALEGQDSKKRPPPV